MTVSSRKGFYNRTAKPSEAFCGEEERRLEREVVANDHSPRQRGANDDMGFHLNLSNINDLRAISKQYLRLQKEFLATILMYIIKTQVV